MAIVTEAEYRIIEEIFLPRENEELPTSMSGPTFVTLYDAIRKRAPALRTERTHTQGKQTIVSNGTSGRMFVINYLCKGLRRKRNFFLATGDLEGPGELRITFLSEKVRALLARASRREGNLAGNPLYRRDGGRHQTMDGIKFLWNFFSQNISMELDSSIRRRNEEVKRTCIAATKSFSLDLFLRRARRRCDSDSDLSSTCSSISFVTASSSSSWSFLRDSVLVRAAADDLERYSAVHSPLPLLGSLDHQDEYYLETPPCTCVEDCRCGDGAPFTSGGFRDALSWQRAHDYFDSDGEYRGYSILEDSFEGLLQDF